MNNAGTSYTNKPTLDVTEEEFQKVFDVNVKGVYLGCNAWIPQAIEKKEGGVIINIASVGATRPRPGLVWYNASKGAIWNVCSSEDLIEKGDCLHCVIGNKGFGSGIWASPDSGKQHLPVGNWYRPLLSIYWNGRHAGEQGEVHFQRSHGPYR